MNEERSRLAGTAWAALLQVHAALVPRLDRALQQAAGLPLSLARYRAAAPHYLASIETEFASGLTDGELGAVAATLRTVLAQQPVPLSPRGPR